MFFLYTGDTWVGVTTLNSGTITDQSPLSPAGHVAFATLGAYLVQGTKTAFNPTFTYSGAARAEAMSAVFKPAPTPTGRSRLIQ